jgi:hypothetical protein
MRRIGAHMKPGGAGEPPVTMVALSYECGHEWSGTREQFLEARRGDAVVHTSEVKP